MLLAEPVIGFRSWRSEGDGLLMPEHALEVWRPEGPTEARCLRGELPLGAAARLAPHPAPHRDCHCGLHAYHSLELLDPERTTITHRLAGAVVAGGRILVAESGFRAERARPLALAANDRTRRSRFMLERLRRVTTIYGVPLVPEEDLEDYARTFGRPYDPATLREPLSAT